MDWKKWLGYNLYKKLWSLIGGRPWTYIFRDVWHEAEWVYQALWYAIGITVGIHFGWKIALIALGIYTFGYINGHLWWGTKYIKGQKGK